MTGLYGNGYFRHCLDYRDDRSIWEGGCFRHCLDYRDARSIWEGGYYRHVSMISFKEFLINDCKRQFDSADNWSFAICIIRPTSFSWQRPISCWTSLYCVHQTYNGFNSYRILLFLHCSAIITVMAHLDYYLPNSNRF